MAIEDEGHHAITIQCTREGQRYTRVSLKIQAA